MDDCPIDGWTEDECRFCGCDGHGWIHNEDGTVRRCGVHRPAPANTRLGVPDDDPRVVRIREVGRELDEARYR